VSASREIDTVKPEDHWQHVKRVFQAALDRDASDRAAFVREACKGDLTLQSEVETLLTAHEQAGDFATLPAIERLDAAAVLRPGDSFGPYEVTGNLGAGGMGEVYRARDSRLGRDVAIKVLPATFSRDPERLARFDREAQLLASLNHPNIAQIYGLAEAHGVRALVLELIEGPTLADRIGEGPISFDEAVSIARQIAEALEAAHNQGIIHRDLKPSNIKLTPDQKVKVLDFGLGKALKGNTAGSQTPHSPTITALSAVGTRLGTAAYMSPEQARGRAADRRSDVWGFGCLLYEMLTGKHAFEGDDISDTFAAILRGEPDWSALPANVPAAVILLIKRCLAKEPRDRIAGMSAALFVLNEPGLLTPAHGVLDTPARSLVVRYPRSVAAGLLLTGAAVAAVLSMTIAKAPTAPPPPSAQFSIALAPTERFSSIGRHLVALSPDGSHLVYVADGKLFLRALNRIDSVAIAGIEGRGLYAPRSPFFSPDGRSIGFWQGGFLKRVAISGGAPLVICETLNDLPPFGASWAADDTILFGLGSVWHVPASGGKAEILVKLAPGQLAQNPQLLPTRNAVLFTLLGDEGDPRPMRTSTEDVTENQIVRRWDDAQVVVQSLDTGNRQVLIEGATDGRDVPNGQIVFVNRGTLFAVPFDATALTVTGSRVAVVDNVAQAPGTGAAHFTFSQTGVFAYVPGDFAPALRTLSWVDRQGRETPIGAPARAYTYPRVSPDGSRLAVTVFDGRQEDVWIWDFAGQRFTRFTSDPADDRYSEWTPDGRDIVFASLRGGTPGLWRQPVDGGAAEQLVAAPTTNVITPRPAAGQVGNALNWLVPSPVSPDNTRIVPTMLPFGGSSDLFLLTLGSPNRLEPLLQTPFAERSAEISPDGRWLAYQSTESGQFEIYVRRADRRSEERWVVSNGGGQHAQWSRDGKELFYAVPNEGLMRVAVEADSVFKASKPTRLLGGPYEWTVLNYGGRLYDASRDGQRFLVLKPVDVPQPSTIVVLQNWIDDLNRRSSAAK